MRDFSTEELNLLIKIKGNYVLIDVRRKEELIYGKIQTSHLIPIQELDEAFDLNESEFFKKYNFKKPKKENLIIFYCRTGARAKKAAQIISQKGYNANTYRGGIWEWSTIDSSVRRYED